jgi:hypothetical protein
LIAAPAGALDAITQTGTEPAVRRLIQVLGGRDVIQALLATDRRRGQLGMAVAALHAVSMTGLALMAPPAVAAAWPSPAQPSPVASAWPGG